MTTAVQLPRMVLLYRLDTRRATLHRQRCGSVTRSLLVTARDGVSAVTRPLTHEALRAALVIPFVRCHTCLDPFLRALPAPPVTSAEPVT